MAGDDQHLFVDDRAGFYMVPTTAIARARGRLCGAQLTEALAGLACLARESFIQQGASRNEQQTLQANLEDLAGRILGVSRARALRIIDNLAEAGAITKEAHRFDGTRRLPTKITFVDLAHSFAYVSGPAFRALRDNAPVAPLGPLALYLTLVALGGEQREQFPDGNRRTARASQGELAKLSGLSVSSVKRAVSALTTAGLISERLQPQHAMKTTTVYRLIDPSDADVRANHHAARSQADRRIAHSQTYDSSQADQPTGHRATDDGPGADRPTARSATNEPVSDPACAHVKEGQRTTDQQNQLPSDAEQQRRATSGGEALSDVERLCEHLAASLARRATPAILRRPGGWHVAAEAWRRSAAEVLEHVDLKRALNAIECIERDAYLARGIRTMPAFAERVDEVLLHVSAVEARSGRRAGTGGSDSAPAWAEAQQRMSAAIRRHGTKRAAAVAELAAEHPAYEPFIGLVGWTNLCREDPQRRQWDWQQAWKQAVGAVTDTTAEEAAA